MSTRYPLAPVAAHLGITLGHAGRHHGDDDCPAGRQALAEAIHVSWTTVKRYHREGLTTDQADRTAARCGIHPSLLWPNWWDDAPGEHDLEDQPCRCRDQQRPDGDICDRCGHPLTIAATAPAEAA